MQYVEQCGVGTNLVDRGGVVVAFTAAPLDVCGAVISVFVGEGLMQLVEECAVCAALVDEGGAVVAGLGWGRHGVGHCR